MIPQSKCEWHNKKCTVKLNNLYLAIARVTNCLNKLSREAVHSSLQTSLDSVLEMDLTKCKLPGQKRIAIGLH